MLKWLFFFIGLVFTFTGSLMLAMTVLKSERLIIDMSKTYWGRNPVMENTLRKDKKLATWGTAFLIPGITLQILSAVLEVIK